ncbi:MAG: FAD-dependent oxidoreductase [Firmicutes bacterium]|nr:FAD-dependent oxidoreductase [Bacillota bacterium]
MDTYIEKSKELPVIADIDVLVCGAGPAGIGAAIRAARLGMSVMIVEAMDCLGGVATAGMMSHWTGYSSSHLLSEIYDRHYKKCQMLGWAKENNCGEHIINQEVLKIVLEEVAEEAKIKTLYYTLVCDALVADGSIYGVIIQNKSGRSIIKAKRIIDATGDGDVAASAGVPFFKGRETDGKMQPCTIMFKVGGVDYERAVFPESFETTVQTEKGELQALAKEILPFPAGHVLLYPQTTPGTVCCNMTNCINIDGTDGESLSKGIHVCRSQIEPIVSFLRKYAPGYENCWLMSSANLLGLRETRHFEGQKSLSAEDILEAKVHSDWVVRRAFFNFDVHNMSGASLDTTGIQKKWKQNEPYTIPYGCLLPKNIEGLLLSGRNISGSHLAHSNFRVMPIAMAVGEAAGTAAALSIKENRLLRNVDTAEIQKIVGE